MAIIPGGVRIGGFISPLDSTNTYPTHDSTYGKGGLHEVASIQERDNIPTERRKEGMLVAVIGNSTYQLVGGLTNSNWVDFASHLAPGSTQKYSQNIGNNSDNTIIVNHNLNTRDITVSVYENSSPYGVIFTNYVLTSVNSITLSFSVTPTTDQYRVVVIA